MKKYIIIVFVFFLCILFFLPSKKYSNEDFQIPTYYSNFDQDQDGIDDQTDILLEARKYLETRPKYKSKYYATGYPNDSYGVCTDVVGFALLKSGYDIKELLNEDVKERQDEYDIDIIDKNIDFRRVFNLQTFLLKHAISLTTDLSKIEEWQGGDIVVFEKHIGIVSNYRNKKGIPFLLHHAHIAQIVYEEDVLESMQDKIIGHFRIS